MTENIYILDTSLFLDLFKIHPIDIYPQFWIKLNQKLDALLLDGRLILTNLVKDEVIHTAGKREDGSDDPAVMWMKERSEYIITISNDLEIIEMVKEILRRFPESADIDKIPPAADPFLIAYALIQKTQLRMDMTCPPYVIITTESRNGKKVSINIDKLRQRPAEKKITELTQIRSICDYYKIESMDIFELFRAEGWTF